MEDRPEYLEGKEFIFEYGHLHLLPLDQLCKDEFGDTIASEQKAYRRERVVRCRDCSSYRPGGNRHKPRCEKSIGTFVPSPNGFCAWGERGE